MADIHIHRTHTLGLAQARKVAFSWAEDVEDKLDMACTYEEGKTEDCVSFTRSGVNGTLVVSKDGFELRAKLGFLVGAFKDKIEAEISKNLDALLAAKEGHKPASKPSSKTATKAAVKSTDKTTDKAAPAKKTAKK
ncbi:MAG: polyhydroxyalkanoic acid system family protein [Burkholderiaceae bacterium]